MSYVVAASGFPHPVRSRKRIAVDIDEVLVPFCKPMFERAGYRLPRGKWDYHYAKALGISQNESTHMVYNFYESQEFDNLKPLPGAQAGVSFLMGLGYDVYIVTGRQDRVRQRTEEWIDRHFPYMINDVILTNSFTPNEVNKADICKSLAINAMIDDSYQVCTDCEMVHIKGINYVGGDEPYPWCHENPMAAHNWDEVTGIVSTLA
jgi:5'(3')-deoxyribonucleotidase